MKLPPIVRGLVLFLSVFLIPRTISHAEGPLFVGGTFGVSGKPFVWLINPLTYWTDQGTLGTLSNANADSLVKNAFQAWQDVPTASINFSQAGKLPTDVTSSNIMTVLDQLYNCSTPINPSNSSFIARDRTIVYDTDGSAIRALGDDPNLVLGEATPVCLSTDGINNFFQRGLAILNGKPLTDGTSTPTDVQATMVHEFGHLIGLDHSQINLNCLTATCTSDDEAGVPIMFPVAVNPSRTTLSTDDLAGISVLYPETVSKPPAQVPFTTLGRIQGRIFFSDGQTQAQGFNVIARQVDDPSTPQNESRIIAVSVVSGFLFTSDAGNVVVPSSLTEEPFGSHDTTLYGFFDIPGLPPGTYTLEVEGINNSGVFPFVFGSSVGPVGGLGFQFLLPGPCSPQLLADEATHAATCGGPADPPPAQLSVTSGAPLTGEDIILIGSSPRCDAWEDCP